MTTSETLERALQLMEERGWTQGIHEDEYGICAARATYMAVTEYASWRGGGLADYMRALKAIQFETGSPNIALWNDNPERTFDQVKEVFRRAAFVTGHQLQEA